MKPEPKPRPTPEQKLSAQLEDLNRRKALYEKKQEIRVIKKQIRPVKMPTWTKLLVLFIFADMVAVQIYSMWAMVYLADLSALYTLISSVVGEAVTFAVYACKSYHETKQEEIIKLERDKLPTINPEDAAG